MQTPEENRSAPQLKRQTPAQKAAGATTRFLHVAGIDPDALQANENYDALKGLFERFGALEESHGMTVCAEKRFCWVRYQDVSSAVAATQVLSSEPCDIMGGHCLHLSYADVSVPPPVPAVAILPGEALDRGVASAVPGLEVIPDFMSVEEENFYLNGLCAVNSPCWQEGISRRVQHYGYAFSYETLTLESNAPSFPAECAATARQLEQFKNTRAAKTSSNDNSTDLTEGRGYFTQLTLNEYIPGQGISSHIDNVECFGDCIYILSLGAGITMLMTENSDPARTGGRDIEDSRLAGNGARDPPPPSTSPEPKETRHIWLPPRSLLILEGASRYRWCHGIAPRKNDQLPNVGLLKRDRRVSLTFRQATSADGVQLKDAVSVSAMTAEEEKIALKQARKDEAKRNIERKKEKKRLAVEERARIRELDAANDGPKVERKKVPSSIPLSAEATKDMETGNHVPVALEQAHVFDVYDQIAVHWHHTRGIRKVYWHRVKDFLDSLPKGTLIADVGSGDGKYFGVNPGVVSIGCDRSEELLKVSWSTEFETLCCDAVKLPYRDNVYDAAICIAVMHHLATVSRRLSLLSEMIRIVAPGGFVVVQAWAQEQGETSKRTFESQDVLVPWQLQSTFTGKEQEKTGVEKKDGEENNGLVNTFPGNNTAKIFQRYCHVYKEGELEELCLRVPNTEIIETGWDKGNWFVKLCKVC